MATIQQFRLRLALAIGLLLPLSATADTYRCLSYNMSGAAGSCSLQPALSLAADGSYTFSSEQGTYTASSAEVVFSGMSVWGGRATRLENQLRFEFELNGNSYTITYYCTDCTTSGSTGTPVGTDSRFSVGLTGPSGDQSIAIAIRPDTDSYYRFGYLYVAALTPTGWLFVQAVDYVSYTSEPKTYQVVQYTGGDLPALQYRELEPTMTFTIPVGNAAALAGISLYIGYGTDGDDMIKNGKYARAFDF